jgi:hypothetical protein
MDMKLVTGITQTNKAGRQYKAKQTLELIIHCMLQKFINCIK